MNDEQQIIEPVPTMAGYKKIPTFKLWIANQFPYIETDFDAITNYELLQAVIKYLNTIIENENNVESNVTALYNSFVNLHDYVENFFDNLDVQEEINNKLDEMVEDGTFESILLNYTQIAKVFDTYNDMMLDTSTYVNGMKLKTLGYRYINDGGGADYIVTNVQSDTKYQVSIGLNKYIEMIIKDSRVSPMQFGAYGDGVQDDLIYLKTALKFAIDNQKELYIDKKYYVSNSLLTSTDYDTTDSFVTLNIKGNNPNKDNTYIVSNFGGIIIANGKSLFKDIKFTGSISNITIAPISRNTAGCVFENCILNSFEFNNNNISNIGAFLIDSNIVSCSRIKDNKFLTVYYFAKAINTNIFLMDSTIEDNYINGGMELNNNSCFQFSEYNGSLIVNNFIDYYRTIYDPINTTNTDISFAGVQSIGNQYQVFRYFYYRNAKISSFTISSDSDVFNWTLPSSLEKLANFESLKYTGHDNVEYDLPPYVMMIDETYKISIKNAYFQRNIGNIVFIKAALGNYNYAIAELTLNSSGNVQKYDTDNYVTIASGTIYSGGNYPNNLIDIPFIHTLEDVPSSIDKWSLYYLGQRIMVNNKLYRRIVDLDNNKLAWQEYKF